MLAETLTHGAEEDAGVGARKDGLEADAVAAAFARILSSLVGDSFSHRDGADPSGLQTPPLGLEQLTGVTLALGLPGSQRCCSQTLGPP